MDGTALSLGRVERPHCTIVTVAGEVDVATAPALHDAVRAAAETTNGPLVVDLTAVRFLASAGMGVLLVLCDELDRLGRELRVVVSRPSPVHRVLELAGIVDVLRPYPTADAAAADVHRSDQPDWSPAD